ncbi:hypothetical protein C9J12_18160 [Photobacterium frigidiphilum]|uniref:Response regulatory domain-containing protein n=1 Tax=Photobacterium frigidiphilum TaxID=264736 RepID=A0A2T3JCM4_9GAMM|nr:response regulator [Photobacterium frigidiphilum]PSU46635.1 hypothetical protein C9J12_18160 [Photobacterium frigidiphilum]
MRDILLVDDNRTMLMFMEKMLTKRGFNVITASDGLQALEVLKVNAHIQFVLSDWMMPEMDGCMHSRDMNNMCYRRYF